MITNTKKSLSVDGFIKELELVAEYFEWHDNGGCLRGFKQGQWFCPITAVTLVLTSNHYDTSKMQEAAFDINMDYQTAFHIAVAADCQTKSYTDEVVGATRNKIKQTIGL